MQSASAIMFVMFFFFFEKNGTTDLLLLEASLRWTQDVPKRCIQKRNKLDIVQQAMVSSIDGINQTNHSTNKRRPCTKQDRSIKLSIFTVSGSGEFFTVLCQITPQRLLLVEPFRQPCDHAPSRTRKLRCLTRGRRSHKAYDLQFPVSMVSG